MYNIIIIPVCVMVILSVRLRESVTLISRLYSLTGGVKTTLHGREPATHSITHTTNRYIAMK